jgi:hypothetical protein
MICVPPTSGCRFYMFNSLAISVWPLNRTYTTSSHGSPTDEFLNGKSNRNTPTSGAAFIPGKSGHLGNIVYGSAVLSPTLKVHSSYVHRGGRRRNHNVRCGTINRCLSLRLLPLPILVLPRYSIDRGFSDTEQTCGETIISPAFVDCIYNRPTFHLVQWDDIPCWFSYRLQKGTHWFTLLALLWNCPLNCATSIGYTTHLGSGTGS